MPMRPNPNSKKKKKQKRVYADSQPLSESSNYPSSTATGNHSHSISVKGAVTAVEMYTSLIDWEPACPTIDSDVGDIEDLQHRAREVEEVVKTHWSLGAWVRSRVVEAGPQAGREKSRRSTGSAILACTKLPDGRIRVVLLQT